MVWTINHHREDSRSDAASLVESIEEIRADGRHTVTFKLRQGNADFPILLSDFHLSIVPADTANFDRGDGTGGYRLRDWEPGVRARTVRNENYWKEGRAHFDEIETIAIRDVMTRTNALRAGEIDCINHPDYKTLHLLEKSPGIQVIETQGTRHYTLPMRTDLSPFDNNMVRLALKHAIPRQDILDKILRGRGVLGNDHPISSANRYFARDLEQRTYDPSEAERLLKQAGVSDITFELHVADSAFAGAVDVGMLIAAAAQKAGINVNVRRAAEDGYWSDVWMQAPWSASYWSGRPSEDWMFSMAYASGATWNETFWKNPDFNRLLVSARVELDESRRREMYAEMQRLVRDEGGAVIPVFANEVMAATDRIQFERVAGNADLDGQKCAERWWFA